MTPNLFATQYDPQFSECWKLYNSRANMPTCSKKFTAAEAWRKTRHIRPPHDIMIRCINLFLDKKESTKRVTNSGRDTKVVYQFKEHFSSWLNGRGWEDYLEQAQLATLVQIEAPQPATRPAFRASSLPDPLTRPTRTAAEILASHRNRA